MNIIKRLNILKGIFGAIFAPFIPVLTPKPQSFVKDIYESEVLPRKLATGWAKNAEKQYVVLLEWLDNIENSKIDKQLAYDTTNIKIEQHSIEKHNRMCK